MTSGGAVWLLFVPLSVVAHLVMLGFLPPLPDMARIISEEPAPPEPETYEVEFRFIPEPPQPLAAPAEQTAPQRPRSLDGEAWTLPRSLTSLAAPPVIDLPTAELPKPEELAVSADEPPMPVFDEIPAFEYDDQLLPPGDPVAVAPPDMLEGVPLPDADVGLSPEAALDVSRPEEQVAIDLPSLPEGLEVSGPVASRITAPPPLPQPTGGKAVTVTFRFSVRPDGFVINPVAIRKGDPELERLAAEFLRKWRFAPLAPNVAQENQSGEVTIRLVTLP